MGGTTALSYSLADRADLLAMARLLTHFLDDEGFRRWTPSALQEALADPDRNVCVVRSGSTLVGLAIMAYGVEDAELELLAVAPLWQRRGLGKALLAWLEAPAEVLGLRATRVHLPLKKSQYFTGLGFQAHLPAQADETAANGPPTPFARPLTRRSP